MPKLQLVFEETKHISLYDIYSNNFSLVKSVFTLAAAVQCDMGCAAGMVIPREWTRSNP